MTSYRYALRDDYRKGRAEFFGLRARPAGCVATGKTLEEVKRRMGEAAELHLRGMRKDGLPIPEPTSLAVYVEAA